MIRFKAQYWRNAVTVIVVVAGLTIAGTTLVVPSASGANVEVVPRDSNAYGNTYSEWSARWWQWVLSIPAATNPNLDTTGANCGEGQSGQVWFLAGTFGGSVTRTCSVPAGKALFFPILNSAFGQGVGDCSGPADCDVTTLRGLAAAPMDNPTTLMVTIDNRKVKNLSQFRVTSPVFNYFFPADNIIGLDPGTYGPLVSDGYWLLIEPLSPGTHTIHFKGVSNSALEIDVTYNLTVGS
jgi:hypothetical protein